MGIYPVSQHAEDTGLASNIFQYLFSAWRARPFVERYLAFR
jgi:hypothetical protein